MLRLCNLLRGEDCCAQPFIDKPTTERASFTGRLQDFWSSPLDSCVPVGFRVDISNVRTSGDDPSLEQPHVDDVSSTVRGTRRAFTKHLEFDPEPVLGRPLNGFFVAFPFPKRSSRDPPHAREVAIFGGSPDSQDLGSRIGIPNDDVGEGSNALLHGFSLETVGEALISSSGERAQPSLSVSQQSSPGTSTRRQGRPGFHPDGYTSKNVPGPAPSCRKSPTNRPTQDSKSSPSARARSTLNPLHPARPQPPPVTRPARPRRPRSASSRSSRTRSSSSFMPP